MGEVPTEPLAWIMHDVAAKVLLRQARNTQRGQGGTNAKSRESWRLSTNILSVFHPCRSVAHLVFVDRSLPESGHG